jgi:hypothetical protein
VGDSHGRIVLRKGISATAGMPPPASIDRFGVRWVVPSMSASEEGWHVVKPVTAGDVHPTEVVRGPRVFPTGPTKVAPSVSRSLIVGDQRLNYLNHTSRSQIRSEVGHDSWLRVLFDSRLRRRFR